MAAPLSIVIPIHSFEPGGVERVALNLALSWQEVGHDVTVVLGRDDGLDRAQAPRLKYELRKGPFRTARFESIWMIWCLFDHLRRRREDVIFCSGNTYAVVCAAARIMLGSDCPPIVAKISNDLVRRDKPWLSRMAYRAWLRIQGLMFDRFVAIAPPMSAEISASMAVPARRIDVVPDPALSRERVDRLLAIPRSGDRGAIVRFIAVGRLAPQKNFALMIRAFARGFSPGDTLTIVGDGPQRSALEALVRSLALHNCVHFTGHIASPDRLLARADCFLLTSTYEGVPAVVIEAIAAGLPILATDCSSSMAELLGGGTRGVLVPTGDLEAFSGWIADALALPEPTSGGRRYAQDFVIEKARDQYLAIMREAVDLAAECKLRSLMWAMRHSGARGV